MMELSHSLILNEEVLKQLPENKRPVFVYEWLRFLDKVLLAAQKSDVQQCNKQLVDQLLGQLQESPGPPSRRLLGSCLSQLFTIGDTFHLLFGTVNRCLELVKSRDDSPAALAAKLGAVCCLGAMYSRLGRMMGRSYEDTVQILTKSMRSAESQMRCEVMRTLGLLCDGIGTAAATVHRDIYKVARHCMTDRVMSVRYAAAHCLLQMLQYYPLLYTGELESMVALCFRALDGSDHQSRAAVAKLLGTLVAKTQQTAASPTHLTANSKGSGRPPARCLTLEDALNILMTGFLRGGSGFLKGTGDMIKGTPAVSREVRVGVTLAYVVFAETMGGLWLERHLSSYITHVLQLSSSPRVAVTHVDTVYVRKCVVYMLRTTLGRMLGEKAQVAACKELASTVTRLVASDSAGDVSNVLSPVSGGGGSDVTAAATTCSSSAQRAHAVICGLLELGTLTRSLGTAAASLITDNTVSLLDCVVSVLIHSSAAARYSAAWCLHCICTAVPSQLTGMIDRCLERLNGLRNSAEAISGYTAALCGLLGAVPLSPLGVPHCSGRRVFGVAEDLLRSAAQNSRLSLARTQTGWMLIGAVASLGHTVVKGLLPRMLLLWRNAFPRSAKELDSEKARGDAFTWQVSLEGRAGALSSMHSLLLHCPELITDDHTRRLLVPVEAAINMLTSLSSVLKTYGQHLKASLAMMRYRLYEVLSLLPANALEGSYAALLRLLVSEFTLADNSSSTSTCLLRSLCQADDSVVLATRLLDPDLRVVEEQLETNSASGSGALEHDITCLYSRRQQYRSVPGPMPLGVAVIDQAIVLFGLLFPRAANKHRIQMLNHFSECIKQAKGMRQEVIQTNIFAALLSGLRGVTDAKTTIGDENVKTPATQLIVSCMCSGNAVLRVAAAEALGRLGQAVSDPRFVSDMAQISFDKLKSARDVISRTGHSLTLGCLHRYVGSMMGNNQQLGTSVSILLALAQDMSSPTVQVWSLHALCMMADAGGPMFRTYVEPILALCVRLLLSVPASAAELHRCVGRCLSALITTVGPELHGNSSSICGTRSSLLCACAVLLSHEDAHIRAEAMHCLQQLHLFAPRQVNLSTLVPVLCSSLGDSQLILRRAAVSCLRQLTQREARRVSSQATQYLATAAVISRQHTQAVQETGLAGLLFSLLDAETDDQLISDVHDTLQAMMLALVSDQLALWLRLCKDVLTTSVDTSTDGATAGDEDADDDMEQFTAGDEPETHPPIPPRWPTRVFAADMLRKLLQTCEEDRTHFDLALAKEASFINQHSDWLILHLSDLIRMAFMAATSDLDPLRLVGLTTLHQLIQLFSSADDPELPGHLLLQQYQAQVSAALRPAFAADTPSHVTARACHVCSAWICSGVAREMSDLKRVHQLLVSSLSKLKSRATIVYNESALTLEKLAILKAWAEVYVVAMEQPNDDVTNVDDVTVTLSSVTSGSGEGVDTATLLNLVKPELANLSKHWLAALKDQALLSLPPEFSCQLPVDGGTFYTNDTVEAARPYYRISWPSILHAAAIWLSHGGFDNVLTEKIAVDVDGSQNLGIGPSNAVSGRSANEINNNRFHLLFGVCMEALCDARGSYSSSVVASCLHALNALLAGSWSRRQLAEDRQLVVELLGAQHRLLLTRELAEVQLLALQVVVLAVRAESEKLEELRRRRLKDLMPANQEPEQLPAELDLLGEGGAFGDIIAGRSAVFSVLQVCLCLLTRFVPALTSPTTSSTVSTPGAPLQRGISPPVSCSVGSWPLSEQLVSSSLRLLSAVPDLCSPRGALSVLPTLLYLCTAVLQRLVSLSNADADTERTLLHTLRVIISHRYCVDERSGKEWRQYVESALAKVIDISRLCDADVGTGGSTVLSVMCEFILHAPVDLVRIESLQQPCINHFQRCADSDDVQIRIHCAELAESVFRSSSTRPAVAAPYIQILAPQLLRQLHSFQPPDSPKQLQLAQQQLSCVQTLLAVCTHDSRTQLLGLYVPALCRFLLNFDRLLSSSVHSRALHQHCMDKLNAIGPLYPQEFKTVVGQSSGLRSCIESAVTATRKLQTLQQTAQSTPRSTPSALTPSANSIKLTMDFSNFRV